MLPHKTRSNYIAAVQYSHENLAHGLAGAAFSSFLTVSSVQFAAIQGEEIQYRVFQKAAMQMVKPTKRTTTFNIYSAPKL